MKLRSFYASEIDSVKNDCIKLLAKNSENLLSQDDLQKFVSSISDCVNILSNKPLDFYFRKK